VGRPPGGHSNLELATKRPGRRKRHRRIVLTLRKKHGASSSASCDVIDDVGDYEIDSHSTGSASEQLAARTNGPAGGELRSVTTKSASGIGNPPRRKRRFDSLPARDVQARRAKMQRYRFEKRTHQKVLHVSAFEPDAESQCDVSPCQVTHTHTCNGHLQVNLDWMSWFPFPTVHTCATSRDWPKYSYFNVVLVAAVCCLGHVKNYD